MTLTVIVTAYEQSRLLENALAGLAVQIALNPGLEVEVVVVDNGSRPPLEEALAGTGPIGAPLRFIWRSLRGSHFCPSSARNIGIRNAQGDFLLFLDGDCVPGPSWLREHALFLAAPHLPIVALGHRVFVDGDQVSPRLITRRFCSLDALPEIRSRSNYGLSRDRRLEEFSHFDQHPMPFNCCHGCNVGVHREDVEAVGGFDTQFDGHWGYEDIEFGYRMFMQGARFVYLPEAFVYHQEGGGLSEHQRALGRARNFELACSKVPGFRDFRQHQARDYYDRPIPAWYRGGRADAGTAWKAS